MAGKTEEKSTKSNTRININSMLVGVATTVLFIIASINQDILKKDFWLTMQLVLVTPLLITSSLAYSKLGYKKEGKRWNTFAWICFVIGFAFMINATAILMSFLGLPLIGILLIFVNLLLTTVYAIFDHKYGDGSISEEITKYFLFFIVQIVLGIGVIFNWI